MSDYMAAQMDSQIEGAISENEALRREVERLRGIVPEVLERLNDELCDENERLRSALAELVAVKDLKERTEALHFAGPLSTVGEGWKAEYEAGRREYIRRQPAAWDAARAAISAT